MKYHNIRKIIKRLKKESIKNHHETMDYAADRQFIMKYVMSCIPYIKTNPKILEFDGGVVYADKIISEKGGSVEYATKKGRDERNNKITYEFDINNEIIEKEFDLIIATQLLEIFVNPIEITKKLKLMLKEDGILIITVSGPAYPSIRGLVSFYTKEGLVKIGREVFGVKNVVNMRSYGDFESAICMLNYLDDRIMNNKSERYDYKHEVICGIVCINK